jgi:hypothetical protein
MLKLSLAHRKVRGAGAALVAAGLALSLVATAGTAQAASADRGADWLARQLSGGTLGHDGYTDYGLTIDAAFAFKAIGGHASEVQAVRQALASNLGSYISGDSFGDPGSTYAGATAKALVLAQISGADPRSFGGVNLIRRLNGVVTKSGPARGRIADVSQFGDFANTLGQVLAVRGLATARSGYATRARTFLLEQQCRQGYFRLTFAKPSAKNQSCTRKSAADPDATSYAVIQLWHTSRGRPAFRAALKRAAAWLVGQQRKSGSFAGGTSTTTPNANSTGLASWALSSAGRCAPARKASTWLGGLQIGRQSSGSTLAGQRGAIAYDKATMKAAVRDGITDATVGTWQRSTAQAAPALRLHGC